MQSPTNKWDHLENRVLGLNDKVEELPHRIKINAKFREKNPKVGHGRASGSQEKL